MLIFQAIKKLVVMRGSSRYYLAIVFCFCLMSSAQVFAMSIIGFKVCIASEMKASVTENGTAVVGAKVTRTVEFANKKYTTEVETDDNGNFILPAQYTRTMWKHTPFEVLIWNRITVVHQGASHLAVDIIKRNFDVDGELNSLERLKRGMAVFTPYEFTCELTDPEYNRLVETNHIGITGKCLYIGETKPEETK